MIDPRSIDDDGQFLLLAFFLHKKCQFTTFIAQQIQETD